MAKSNPPPRATFAASWWFRLAEGGFFFVATLIAYSPALRGTLLWDDDAHVTKPALQSLDGLRRIWFELGASQQYYPILHSAFWLEHKLWGDAVLGYHLTNVLLHATAACFVAAIARKLFADAGGEKHSVPKYPGVGWLAGTLFGLHPICVESVAWISEQKNTLSAVFGLSAVFVYLSFAERRTKTRYFVASGLFVLALLSKTVTATLPAALLVIFWWKRGRLDWRRDVGPLLPWLVVGASAGLFTAWVERKYFVSVHLSTISFSSEFSLNLLDRCLLAGRVICFYFTKLLWPTDLSFIYPKWTVSAGVWSQYFFPVGVLLVAGLLTYLARSRRGPLAAFLIFVGTLFPVLGFFDIYPFLFSYVADHFQYLASLAVIVPVAALLSAWLRSIGAPELRGVFLLGAVSIIAVVLGSLTIRQCAMYRDAQTLYEQTLARNPDCWLAHGNLGLILAQDPTQMSEALAHFDEAVRLNPNNPSLHDYRGTALARTPGRQAEAVKEFETALRLSPNFPYAHVNLGIALLQTPGRADEALGHFQAAVRVKPDYAEAHNFLGYALAHLSGRELEAIAEYEAALRLKPDYLDAHSNLAIALSQLPGRMNDAIEHFGAVVGLNPTSPAAHFNLGYALAMLPDRHKEALVEFERVQKLAPDDEASRTWIARLRKELAP